MVLLRIKTTGDSISDCSERTALKLVHLKGIMCKKEKGYLCLKALLQGIICCVRLIY